MDGAQEQTISIAAPTSSVVGAVVLCGGVAPIKARASD
jgi:hypothetical protein